MAAPVEIVQEFLALPEEAKVLCSRVNNEGPYFLFEGYELSLMEVSVVNGGRYLFDIAD